MSTQAQADHYFDVLGYPVTAMRVQSDDLKHPSHPFDLTGIEHDHDFTELVIVTHGRGIQRLDRKDYPVSAGDVYLLQGRCRHFFHDRAGLELINVMYDPQRLPLPESELRKSPGYSALFVLEPRYRRQHNFSSRLQLGPVALAKAEALAESIESESAAGTPGHGAALLAYLLELIVFLSRQYGKTQSREGRSLLRVGNVIGSLESDPARNWTVDEMATLAHMSNSTLFRVFRKATGSTPMDYLIRARIHEALRLLRETDKPITEIALNCGFSDSNYFSRQFRRLTGQTPTSNRNTGTSLI